MVILFDGVCNLCNGFVQFVLKRDKKQVFQFASLQSSYGMGLSQHFNLPTTDYETIVLFDGKKILTESDAVLKILYELGGLWKTVIILKILPRFLCNWAYRLVARNRYKLFGKRKECMMPNESLRNRFLNDSVFTI